MVKGSAEGMCSSTETNKCPLTFSAERIMQTGKKKLVLDHLIVQKMDDDTSEDVQSILTFGAQALFQDGENSARDIYCEIV